MISRFIHITAMKIPAEREGDGMIEYLFKLIENGISEEEALYITMLKYHKYELRGNGKEDSLRILKEMYYGKTETTSEVG